MPIALIKTKISREYVFSNSSFRVKAVKNKLRIALYALHERRICSTIKGQLHASQYGLFSRFRRNARVK